jgi:hypothetical protein
MLRWIALTSRCSIVLVFAVLAQLSLQAQQIAAIDLTQMTARTDLRRPPSSPGTPDGSSGAHDIHGCPDFHKNAGALRTTLVSLDRAEYKVGDEVTFEVTIENIGSSAVRIPFSPHLADLQPEDPSQKFAYFELSVDLWVGGKQWETTAADIRASLYGADGHPETLLSLQPGESVRVTGKSKIVPRGEHHVTSHPSRGDTIDHANARSTITRTETMLGARTSASVSNVMCVISRQGPDVPIKISELAQ